METLKQKLSARKTVLGTMLSEVANPNMARIMKAAGFELIIVDCEHGYFDFSQLAAIASLGNGFGLPVLVRIPEIRREWITKALDMSCDGLLVPMVNTAQQALEVIRYAKYQPLGERGISTTRAHTNYNPPPLGEYMRQANERTCILVQLETAEAIANVREIAAVDGVDALMIGPNDLASDLGSPGKLDTDEMFQAIETVAAAAQEVGKSCGIISSGVSYLQRCKGMGMNLFSCNSEVGLLMKAARNCVKEFHSC